MELSTSVWQASFMQDERTKSLWIAESEIGFYLVLCQIRISFIRGPLEGETYDVPGPELRIGSADTCDLVIPDRTVSHVHSVLRIVGDGIRIIDAGSKNGTYVNNVRINDAYVEPDASITLGMSAFRIRLLTEFNELPLSNRQRFGHIVGKGVAMRRIYSVLEVVANTTETLLIEGEPGTGKSTIAEAIHAASVRSDEPFVTFDCANHSRKTIETELFGGTTGVSQAASEFRRGCFDEAYGGTLVLEEVGALPIEFQWKLLAMLDRRTYRPLGMPTEWEFDVRIIATTTRDLVVEVRKHRFCEGLYHRLSMRAIRLPPLRDQVEDIPLFVRHFENEWCSRTGKRASIPDSALEALTVAPWPGNVRELQSTVERLLAHMSRDGI